MATAVIRLMRIVTVSALLALPFFAHALVQPFETLFPDLAESEGDAIASVKALTYRQGTVELAEADAVLEVPAGYYFLDAADAQTVLVDMWGNPPGSAPLGMLFPSDVTPLHDGSWGVELTWDPMGYVSDEDAAEIDYDELLETMQRDTTEESKARVEAGYESVALVGWAEPPHYDLAQRKLYWAQEIAFGGNDEHTLNYNIRALGRRGVLQMNFIAGMSQLDDVRTATPDVLAMSTFKEGSRYEDFVPGADTVAAVGLGGLVAGKVLAKTGLLATALVLLKKFWFVLLLPFYFLRRLFTGGDQGDKADKAAEEKSDGS